MCVHKCKQFPLSALVGGKIVRQTRHMSVIMRQDGTYDIMRQDNEADKTRVGGKIVRQEELGVKRRAVGVLWFLHPSNTEQTVPIEIAQCRSLHAS
jgi:hypothetical protein